VLVGRKQEGKHQLSLRVEEKVGLSPSEPSAGVSRSVRDLAERITHSIGSYFIPAGFVRPEPRI